MRSISCQRTASRSVDAVPSRPSRGENEETADVTRRVQRVEEDVHDVHTPEQEYTMDVCEEGEDSCSCGWLSYC